MRRYFHQLLAHKALDSLLDVSVDKAASMYVYSVPIICEFGASSTPLCLELDTDQHTPVVFMHVIGT